MEIFTGTRSIARCARNVVRSSERAISANARCKMCVVFVMVAFRFDIALDLFIYTNHHYY